MNLHSKKARVPIAALGVAALCTGGMGAFASTASATPTSIDLNSNETAPVVANFGTSTTATAATAFGLKIQDASDANMAIELESQPTGGHLAFEHKTSNAAPSAGGFSTLPTAGTNEVQTVTISGTPTGGTFLLTYAGQTTGTIPYNATAATVQAALMALSNVGAGQVAVSGGPGPATPYTVTFTGTLGSMDVAQMSANGAGLTGGASPAVAVTTATPGAASGVTGATLGTVANTDYTYITGDVPGTYKLRLFQDTNGNLTYDSADERATDLITLTVDDAVANTVATSDDVSPVITATSPTTVGLPVPATITYDKALSMSDARGTGAGSLGAALAAQTFVDVAAGGTGVSGAVDSAATYTPSTQGITYAVGTPSTTGTVAIRADFSNGTVATTSNGSKNVVVQSNGVTGVTLAATDVSGSVKSTTATAPPLTTTVAAKKSSTSITYKATVTNSGTPADIAGKTVYFTLGGSDVASLTTTGGTTVDATNHVYSAVTDSTGAASLTVVDGATSVAGYTVQASTNGITSDSDATTGGNQALPITYSSEDVGALAITTSQSDLTVPPTATSVVVKGKLTDQFGGAFTPGSTDPLQVSVSDGSTTSYTPLASDGTFSYSYTPSSTAAVGSSVTLTFSYTSGHPTTKTATAVVQYTSATAASSLTLTAPAASAAEGIEDHTSPIGDGVPVSGTVYDSGSSPLAYKAVTLSGDGVYFSTTASPTAASATDDLTKTFTVTTDASGNFTGYAFFTKPGSIDVKAASGTAATKDVTVTVAAPTDPYNVTVDDETGDPGSTLIVTGKVTDIFGNGVTGATVDLSTGTSTVGTISNDTPITNSDGVFSTTFVSGSNQSGAVTLTATLTAGGVPLTSSAALIPSPDWLNRAGVTLAPGLFQSSGKITVADLEVTLTATTKVTGSGSTKISGTFSPLTSVDIYAKASGADSYTLFDSIKTDSDGNYSASYPLKKTTKFLARSGGLSSAVDTTTVYSAVTLTGKSSSHDRATFSANGAPSAKGTLTFYRSVAGKDPILRTITSNTSGNGSVTVTLPKGSRKVYVIFKAPGTSAGTSKTVTLKVK